MLGLSPTELLIIGVIAVLLFGKRLPEVGRSIGKSIVEFKKGLNDIKSEVDAATYAEPGGGSRKVAAYHSDDRDEPTAPKFELPEQEPTEESARAEA